MRLLKKLGRFLKRFERGRKRFFEDVDRFNDRDDLPYTFDKRKRTRRPRTFDKRLRDNDDDEEYE